MTPPKYYYTKLAGESHQVRLVTILPKNKTKVLRLEMMQVGLEDIQGQYEAISYMWGSTMSTRRIVVNDQILHIHDNIWRCLKNLRDKEMPTSKLWIDSICINQADCDEKNRQVAMMRKIFSNASKILIWLGSTSMRTYLNDSEGCINTLPPGDYDTWTDLLGHSYAQRFSLVNQVMSIAFNPYWYRLWIVQEIVLAPDICIIFGDIMLPKSLMGPIYHTARENSKPGYCSWFAHQKDPSFEPFGTALLDHHPILHGLYHDKTVKNTGSQQPFGELIRSFQWQFCSDPRDYVYGLLEIFDSSFKIKVDYRLSNEEVALQALQLLREESAPPISVIYRHRPFSSIVSTQSLDCDNPELLECCTEPTALLG